MLIGFYDKTPAIAGAAILPPEVRRALAKIPNPPRSQIINAELIQVFNFIGLRSQCNVGADVIRPNVVSDIRTTSCLQAPIAASLANESA